MANTKISALASQTAPVNGDLLVTVDVSDVSMGAGGTDKKITLSAIFDFLHPVGSYYSNGAVSTNPATLFGSAGTWIAVAGMTIVGLDVTQTEFNTLLKTGGEKTHLLLSTESGMVAHNHGGYTGDTEGALELNVNGSGSNRNNNRAGFYHKHTIPSEAAANAASAHNNLQPYEVAAIWRRTA